VTLLTAPPMRAWFRSGSPSFLSIYPAIAAIRCMRRSQRSSAWRGSTRSAGP
jgi:hypothetical protein